MKPVSGESTAFVGGGTLGRLSSRTGRLDHVLLRDRLRGASEYLRIAGYFRSSIFELVHEELVTIDKIRVVCNADLDARDLRTSQLARQAAMLNKWNQVDDELDTLLHRERYEKLYELLRHGNLQVRVVANSEAPFLHGKAGVIRRTDGSASAFIGSLNETREGWSTNYEMVWEDTSADGVAWVQGEFEHLWELGIDLPDVVIEEIGRSARKRQVQIKELAPAEVAPAALVEAPLYRQGEELKPWQRAFVATFLEHREIYGRARLLLADEVGVGKTLSLAGAALVACLLGDGPTLILCPATLCQQWQIEMWDKLGIPSGVWLSQKKEWIDHRGHRIRTRGAEDVVRCPFQIGIVSTGLIFQATAERELLLTRRFGTLIVDEVHRARRTGGIGLKAGEPNNLLLFIRQAASNARHVLLSTATPIQTSVDELWDLLDVLNQSADHVMGRLSTRWRRPSEVVPVLTGKKRVEDEQDVWQFIRNPLPPAAEAPLFDQIRTDLDVPRDHFFVSEGVESLSPFTRATLLEKISEMNGNLSFLQLHNPFVRHVVLRRRSRLEEMKLIPRIAVDIYPIDGYTPMMFDGVALRTAPEFDTAYAASVKFCEILGGRRKSAGFMKTLLLQRICSSYASGLSTARKLMEKHDLAGDDDDPLDAFDDLSEAEREQLEIVINQLAFRPTDPKLDAVVYYLLERNWLMHGTIIFSQYFDTAEWVASNLAGLLPDERIALYAGSDWSRVYFKGEWRSVDRNQIKKAVRDRQVRLVVATDAACEGLNLQTLGTLINVDLPWNPSRLEQRIGRIKRFGQARDRVDMLNLVYKGSHDEHVYAVLSKRMKDRYDLLGSLPDVIDDDWIEDIEKMEEHLSQYTKKREASRNAFDVRYGGQVMPEGPGWERCEKVLARRDVVERLSKAW